MTSVYSKSLQILNAKQFKKAIEETAQPYLYLGFGKVIPWADDNAPPQANTSVSAFNDVWKNLIGAKLIKGNDARLAIRRFDWQPNQSYNAYDDCSCSMNMNDANNRFYVVTDEWNVYKCLSNNNGSLSTEKPTLTTAFVEEKSDKYIWKYMYTLTDEERLRFTTSEYIPVKTLTEDNGSLQWQVQNTASQSPGAIETVRVTNPGTNYSVAPSVLIVGDGSGANAIARINATTSTVESIIINDSGSGYTYANVIISASTGTTAQAEIILSPPGGHGSDPVEELGASFVILNPRLRGSESGVLDVVNEFRQVSIIENPYLKSTRTLATNTTYSQTTTIYLQQEGDEYYEDEIVFQGQDLETSVFSGTVASWDTVNSVIKLVNVSGNPTTAPLIGRESRSARFVNRSVPADLEPYTGNLIYTNNIKPIQRSSDQTEDFKIVISF
jgi:hypothetical protein